MTTLVKNNKLQIKTPLGFEKFYGMQTIKRDRYVHLKFLNGAELKCSENHPIYTTNDGIITAKELTKYDEIITDEESTFVVSKRIIKRPVELFDILNSGKLNQYYTNSILSHNCNFLGSQATLIDAPVLQALSHEEPIENTDHFKVYARPQPGRKYFIAVDVAEGIEEDASAFIVFDITEIPYTIAGVYLNNNIAPMLYPTSIVKIAKLYNNAYVLTELNARGAQVADILHYENEYANLLMTAMRGRHGVILGQAFSNKCKFGVVINPNTKKLGCSNLKTLIESHRLLITDFNIISELTTYIQKGTSYAADHGAHDDLVSALVVFAWACVQPYFREITDINTIANVVDNSDTVDEFELLGGLSTGKEDETIVDGNLLWNSADSQDLFEYGATVNLWSYH